MRSIVEAGARESDPCRRPPPFGRTIEMWGPCGRPKYWSSDAPHPKHERGPRPEGRRGPQPQPTPWSRPWLRPPLCSSIAKVASLGFLVLFLAACATGKRAELEILWPLPPDPPRIKYVGSISSVDDVRRDTFGRRVRETVVGKDPTARLGKPYAVHVDRDGRIYVADSAWRKVLMFDRAGHEFRILGLDGPGVLSKPLGVTTDQDRRVYVTDTVQNRVVVFDPQGEFVMGIGERGRFGRPVGIAVNDALGRVYVVDTRKHSVMVFKKEDGAFLFEFGGRGTEDGRFNFPTNVALDRDGNVYVMDTFNWRVEIFDADGKFLGKFGGVGSGFGQFSKPKGIGVDSEGHIYVADAAFNNVQIFDRQGQLLLFFSEFGNRAGQLWLPAGLAIDSQDRIYVADQYNKRINIYQYLAQKESVEPKASNLAEGSADHTEATAPVIAGEAKH